MMDNIYHNFENKQTIEVRVESEEGHFDELGPNNTQNDHSIDSLF